MIDPPVSRIIGKACYPLNMPLFGGLVKKRRAVQKSKTTHQENKRQYFVEQLGGWEAMSMILAAFTRRVMQDEQLTTFFHGSRAGLIQRHATFFFTMAFTRVPDDLDLEQLILTTHRRAFDMGLNVRHFDRFQEQLRLTLESRGFEPSIVEEVEEAMAPLRKLFSKHSLRRRGAFVFLAN